MCEGVVRGRRLRPDGHQVRDSGRMAGTDEVSFLLQWARGGGGLRPSYVSQPAGWDTKGEKAGKLFHWKLGVF